MNILYLIIAVVVAFFSLPVVASFIYQDFLNRTTYYASGHTMDGYEFVFWGVILIYGIVGNLIASRITGISFLGD